jgi:hypothetical protein
MLEVGVDRGLHIARSAGSPAARTTARSEKREGRDQANGGTEINEMIYFRSAVSVRQICGICLQTYYHIKY